MGFSLEVLKYVVCLCKGCDSGCVFCLYCEEWSCRCSCMGSMSVSSCRCCIFVSCVHPVALLNAAFCMTFLFIFFIFFFIGRILFRKNPTKKYSVEIIYMIMTKIRRYKIINNLK